MGAKKGNSNALKHGLYARHIEVGNWSGLRDTPPGDQQEEIVLMRAVVRNLFGLHARLQAQVNGELDEGRTENVEQLAKLTNSLSLAITALNTIVRTQAILSARDGSVNDAFAQGLASLPVFAEEKYLLTAGMELEEEEEILAE
jgi:hypothetical protein